MEKYKARYVASTIEIVLKFIFQVYFLLPSMFVYVHRCCYLESLELMKSKKKDHINNR